MAEPVVQLKVSVEASLKTTNGVVVAIDEKQVVLRQPGARGGSGPEIRIPLSDWDAVAEGVAAVRRAVAEATTRIAPGSANR